MIFYINLPKRKDRRIFMEKNLQRLRLPYQRFSAVRPSSHDLLHGKYKSIYERHEHYPNFQRTTEQLAGEFGCYISHLEVHKLAKELKYDRYLILEDDCVVFPWSLRMISTYLNSEKIPNDWDLLRSCRGSTKIVDKIEEYGQMVNGKYETNLRSNGTHFTMVNGKNVDVIINYIENSTVRAIDAVYSTPKLNVYGSKFKVKLSDRKLRYKSDICKIQEMSE